MHRGTVCYTTLENKLRSKLQHRIIECARKYLLESVKAVQVYWCIRMVLMLLFSHSKAVLLDEDIVSI